ncbi:iron ABC transporter permease [Oricola sp.]|uniref:ABC transporter permease n=1 Tax=Oricola sp. TaxID=1979950 RepID=UPI0025D98494|nr:iron ABC transporter permease [Oricola sp.]MCI5078135.1 iron ABC transporter permease [Oricola sp.]
MPDRADAGIKAIEPDMSVIAQRAFGRAIWLAFAFAMFVLFVWPVLMLAIGSFRTTPPGAAGDWTLDGVRNLFTNPGIAEGVQDTLFLSFFLTIFVTLLAVFFSWVVARTNTPLRWLVTPLMVVVLATPQLFFGLSWAMLGNESAGLINYTIRTVTGTSWSPFNVESWSGIIFVLTLKVTAFGYLLMVGPFGSMDRTLEEASRTSGAGAVRTFFRVTIPVLTPAVAGVAILVFTNGLESFDIPLLLGLPAGIGVLATQIYDAVNKTLPPNYAAAGTLSLLLTLTVMALVLVRSRIMAGRSYAVISGKGHKTEPADIGGWRFVATGLILVYALLAVILPLVQMLVGSLQPVFGLYRGFTLDNYLAVLDDSQIVRSLVNTAIVAVIGGFVAMTLAVIIGYVGRHSGRTTRHVLEFTTWLPWTLPGVVLGLAMLWAYISLPGLKLLYSTIWILMIGLIVAVIPVVSRVSDAALVQIGPELEESSRVAGGGRIATFFRIVLPLIAPSFVAGWTVAGIMISGNLAIPVMLSSATSQTVPVQAYDLYIAGEVSQTAAIFCIQLGGILVALIAVGLIRAFAGLNARRKVGTGDLAPSLTDSRTGGRND